MSDIDYAAVLAKIRPGAAWRMSATYQQVVDTWGDKVQTVPTEQEMIDAWPGVQEDIAALENDPTLDEKIQAMIDHTNGNTAPLAAANVRIVAAKVARKNLP